MRRLFKALPLLFAAAACGTPPLIDPDSTPRVDGGTGGGGGGFTGDGGPTIADAGVTDGGIQTTDAGVGFDGGVLPPNIVRPLYFATADQTMPAPALMQLNTLWSAMRARFREETRLTFELAPAVEHISARTCAQLGANANGIINTIRTELAPDGNTKFQVIVPCDDPSGSAAGVAYVGGAVAVTFDGAKRLGGASSQAYLTTVAMHELAHNFGLVHNSVGNNCMGPVELRSFALGLLGNTETAPCVLLPYQRDEMLADSAAFLVADAPVSFTAAAPSLTPTASKLSGRWQVVLSWLGGLPAGAAGWHIERNATRILRVRSGNSDTDSDGPAEYHNDPMMTDPGLQDGQRYCYRLRAYDAVGNEAAVGPEACVNL